MRILYVKTKVHGAPEPSPVGVYGFTFYTLYPLTFLIRPLRYTPYECVRVHCIVYTVEVLLLLK